VPRVSIITPAYNAANYLAATIASAQRQIVQDFEMLVVDDGSTDGTATLTEQFADRDPRIRLIRQRNGGSASARNTAMREAQADFFALLDSDDVWHPDFLREQLGILDKRPEVDIVSANAINLGGWADGHPLKPASTRLVPISLLDLIQFEDSVCIMSIFRRSVIERVGGFDARATYNEDYELWLRAARAGCPIVFNEHPLGWYRRRKESKSADEAGMLAGIVGVLTRFRPNCADRPAALAAIDQQIARYTRRRLTLHTKAAFLRFALQA
jgi:glycosyltransferase involved in cell wall biosynthesis